LDAPARRTLVEDDLVFAARRRRLWSALASVAEQVQSLGIEVATVKGVTAEARWYDRPGERPCSDLDLFVGPADVDRAAEIVAILQPDHPLRRDVGWLAREQRLQNVDLRVGDVAVDLH